MGCTKQRTGAIFAAALGLAFIIAGCKTSDQVGPTGTRVDPLATDGDLNYVWRGFPQPALSPEQSEILVEKRVPRSVRPQQQFEFTIKVTNNAAYKIDNVTVTEEIPRGFKFVKASPAEIARETLLKWELGTLQPKTSKVITVTGVPTQVGTIRYSGETMLNFKVATDSDFASTVNVIEPKLVFDLSAPATSLINAKLPVNIVFRNTGEATVLNAKMVHSLPKGLLEFKGRSTIDIVIGNLNPGEKKEFPIDLKGVQTGKFETTLTAVADEGVTASASLATTITKPVLAIVGEAPNRRFVGRETPYDITVKNTGDAIADKMVVNLSLPDGVTLQSATEGGQAKGQEVAWNLGSLAPGASKKVTAIAVVRNIMVARAIATAEAVEAEKVEVPMVTNVAGVAGLLTTLVDINDPVPLGQETTYQITATNTGSLPSTGVKVKCILEESMEYINSSGATKGQIDGKVLTFEPLPGLNPQAAATWRVVVKAAKEGDVRFRVLVESDQLDRPVELFESTHFYK